MVKQRLRGGTPLAAQGWEVVGGHSGVPRARAPEWLRDADQVLVHADDTIIPVQ